MCRMAVVVVDWAGTMHYYPIAGEAPEALRGALTASGLTVCNAHRTEDHAACMPSDGLLARSYADTTGWRDV